MDIAVRKLQKWVPTLKFDVRSSMSLASITADQYKNWLPTVDHTVCGQGSTNIPDWLPKVAKIEAENWDSYGLEAVSRIFSTDNDQGDAEIRTITNVLTGNSSRSYGSFITNQCGLHVHVQAPDDMNVLKELATVLLVYEHEISRPHPRSGRSPHPATIGLLASNRTGWLRPPGAGFETNYPELDCSTTAFAKVYPIPLLHQSFSLRFNTKENLSKKMCGLKPSNQDIPVYRHGTRNRLVNFTATCRAPDPTTGNAYSSTIEFRQARGSLSPYDILKWIEFCIGLRPPKYVQAAFASLVASRPATNNLCGIRALHESMWEQFPEDPTARDNVLVVWRHYAKVRRARGVLQDEMQTEEDIQSTLLRWTNGDLALCYVMPEGGDGDTPRRWAARRVKALNDEAPRKKFVFA
ncbi:hypothetical protein B0O99DRAFT_597583 [Bisporella sp. PMI_857]|nr:hypothetical protein B0O99DRAFT_597583 [Bisporella sp. PMI_857]